MDMSKLAGSSDKSRKKIRIFVLNMNTGKVSSVVVYSEIEAVWGVLGLKDPFKFICVDSDIAIQRDLGIQPKDF